MAKPATRTIEVFRPGSFVALNGQACAFSADDLKAIAAAYDAAAAPAPGVVGHPKTDDPAFAWATAFRFDEGKQRLVADMGEIEPAFAEAVAAGRYKKISLSLFPPDAANNPKPGQWYPKHIGFLGAAAPAVSGLKPVSFAADDGAVTFEFGEAERAVRDIASLFRSLREFLIGEHGQEAADIALPRWTIDWIDEKATRDIVREEIAPAFAAPQTSATKDQASKEVTMTVKSADSAALDARAADLDKRERALLHSGNLAFAEVLVAEGRLLPVLKDKVVALLDFAAPQIEPFEFADGDKTVSAAPVQLLKEVLTGLPKAVTFGAHDFGDGTRTSAAEFAAPDGMTADPGSLELHARALAYQAQHAGIDYLAAITAVNR